MEFKKIKLIIFFLALAAAGLGWFFIFSQKTILVVKPSDNPGAPVIPQVDATSGEKPVNNVSTDIEPQKPVIAPPSIIKAVYMTSWSAGTESRIDYLINLKKTSGVNAAVIDIKDYSGLIAYDINLPQVDQYKTKEVRIKNINELIKRLHDEGIYVIAREAVFEDPALAKARPDLAVKKKSAASPTSTPVYSTWKDNKGLSWADPSSKEVWDYNIAIAKDAASRGFDEINFDYIRFPSDGDMASMYFLSWDQKTPKHVVLRNFFKYLRESLPNTRISADIFGLVTSDKTDMGIGQVLEDVYPYFDFVSPMVYPSHYYAGTLGYKNPAEHPYEIVKYSIDSALKRLIAMENPVETGSSTSSLKASVIDSTALPDPQITAKIRPWLQDFNMGADYTADMVEAEIKAVSDSLGGRYNGFMMWNPSNVYTKAALL